MPTDPTVPLLLVTWATWHAVVEHAQPSLRRHDLSLREFLLLSHVVGGRVRAGELGDALYLPKYTVSRTLDTLTERGSAVRHADPDDVRRQLVQVTLPGGALHDSARQAVEARFAPALRGLGPEAERLLSLLERFEGHLRRAQEGG